MTPSTPVPLAEVDLGDIDRFATPEGPWGMFDTLRREDPVHWNEEADGNGFWAVTRLRRHLGRGEGRARPTPRRSSSTSRRSTTNCATCGARSWRRTGRATRRCAS